MAAGRFIYMIKWMVIAACWWTFSASAQERSPLLGKAARLEGAFREEEALSDYQRALQLQPANVFILCRCCDLICRIGNRQVDREQKISYFETGYHYAQTAYRLDSTNSDVNVMMAFSLGRLTLIQSNKERVEAAIAIRRYAERAIRYDPSNFKAYHILGRWHYEVSKLNVVERAFARWFYGALPEASLEESIRYYEKSLALRPDFMLNYLELARAFHRQGQDMRAVAMLRRMEGLHDEMYDDRTVRAEGKKLLEALK